MLQNFYKKKNEVNTKMFKIKYIKINNAHLVCCYSSILAEDEFNLIRQFFFNFIELDSII